MQLASTVTATPPRIRIAVAAPPDPARAGHDTQVRPLTVGPDGHTGDALADKALHAATVVDEVLRSRFGRDGIDGAGGSIEVVVHASDRTNAYWDSTTRRIELGDGDGVEWGAFAGSLGVVAHELYHGVVDSEVKLDYERPEQAALHESFADVFAAGVIHSWRIGEDVRTPDVPGDEIRDLAHPEVAHLRDAKQAGGEAHALSGLASLAAVRVAERIGDDAMQSIWYHALVDELHDGADFAEAARATTAAAGALHGASSSEVAAVRAAWESVGIALG